MSNSDIPWMSHLVRGVVVLFVVILFQQITRETVTIPIAIIVAIGFVVVSELASRYRARVT